MSACIISTGDRIRTSSALGISGSNTCSISFWLIPDQDFTTGNLRMCLWTGSPYPIAQIREEAGSSDRLDGFFQDSTGSTHHCREVDVLTSALDPIFITLTWDGSTVRMYVNAVEVATNSTSITFSTDDGFHLGETGNTFTGVYGDPRCYSRVLPVEEIELMYTARGRDGNVLSNILRWTFFEREPGTVITSNLVTDITDADNDADFISGTPEFDDSGDLCLGYRRRAA